MEGTEVLWKGNKKEKGGRGREKKRQSERHQNSMNYTNPLLLVVSYHSNPISYINKYQNHIGHNSNIKKLIIEKETTTTKANFIRRPRLVLNLLWSIVVFMQE